MTALPAMTALLAVCADLAHPVLGIFAIKCIV
jgi:hypothetical protein